MLNIQKILKALNENNVKYVVIGGTAAIAQGSAHLTFDLDICYDRDKSNLKNLVKAFTPFHPYLRGAPKDLPFIFDAKTLNSGLNFTFATDAGDVDLIGELSGLGKFDEVIKYSEKLQIYDTECYVLTLEGLIKDKKHTRRPKDLRLLTELEALLEIKKGNFKA
jgi:predicted nucleotidyltransferase